MQRSAKSKIKYFLKETLRPRGKEDYARVFKCGEVKRRVPWLYLRALAAGFLLFCISVLAYRLSGGSVDYMTAVLFGALMFNIPVLIFFYELNPWRDISLLTLILTVIIGGSVACAVLTLGYEYIYSGEFDSPWISLLWTGFWEEFVKAAAGIAAACLLKKKSPLACFLIGFAVGTGYSILEDMGYIYSYSRSQSTTVTWVVLMSVGRSLSCGVSHAPWTGMILWAFAKFKKPFLNFRFYGVVIASMVLHYFADVPFFAEEVAFLTGLNWGWLIEIAVVAAIVALVYFAWKNSFKELPPQCGLCEDSAENLPKSVKLNQAGNAVAVACAAVFGIFTLAGCAQSTGVRTTYERFDDKQSFVSFVQDGLNFDYDWNRAYDPEYGDYSLYMLEQKTVCAVQKVPAGGYDYFYEYSFGEEGAALESIGVQVENSIYYCAVTYVFEDFSITNYREPSRINPVPHPPIIEEDPVEPPEEPEQPPEEPEPAPVLKEKAEYFFIKGVHAGYEDGQFTVVTGVKDADNTAAYIAFGVLAGVTALGGTAAVITLKIKSRRNYDD